MQKPRPIITEQQREEIHKVSDLVEVAGSRADMPRWCVSGVAYSWKRGAAHVKCEPMRGEPYYIRCVNVETIPPSKATAKKAIFEDLRA